MEYRVQSLDLKRFSNDLARSPSTMARAERRFFLVAARTVAGMAKGMAYSAGGVAAKSASDIRATGPSTVIYGGKGYSMGAEFGSYKYRQFQMWRGNGDDAGYFLWPAIRMFRDKDFVKDWSNDVWDVVRQDLVS